MNTLQSRIRSLHDRWAAHRAVVAVIAFAVMAGAFVWVTPTIVEASPTKITICHRTHSLTNPYRRITVSTNAAQNGGHGGHGLPNGSSNPAVFDPTVTYASNNKYWGDVIPGASDGGGAYNGTTSLALNWSAAGQAIFFGGLCPGLTARQFYDVELAAGVPSADIIADLNDMAANEDVALLAALGGSFTSGNLSTWTTAVSVTTNAATSVGSAGATLNGSLTVGATSTVAGFQYGTSSTLASPSSVSATPSPVTNTTAVTAALSGLTPSTTYYFRVTGTTNAGTDTEGILYGDILSFTTDADGATTTTAAATTTTATVTTTTTAAATTTTAAETTTTAAVTTTTAAETTTAAAVTTTAAATTTTAAAATTTVGGSAGTASVLSDLHGIVWFDRNRNGVFDGNEWVLPGVTVTLLSDGTGITGSFAPLRTQQAGFVGTTVTAADGSYSFASLQPGGYRASASASIAGFEYTSDTDGATDWIVDVKIPAGRTERADFAGLGKGQIVGQVYETTTMQGLPYADVTCHWAGYDDVLGTADDVAFAVVASVAGAYDFGGVPYGKFTCDGLDRSSGRVSAPADATVLSPQAVTAELPVQSPMPVPAGALPTTGSNPRSPLVPALVFLVVGTIAVRLGRRKSRFNA